MFMAVVYVYGFEFAMKENVVKNISVKNWKTIPNTFGNFC